MIYTIELYEAERVVCAICDRFKSDAAALEDAKKELQKGLTEEVRVYRFGPARRDRIATLKALSTRPSISS
ncbi:MAG: hypothetical protein B7W99_00865 [Rhodospirillales bacterium 20-58-10]|nr:MAG: hypothetical protein B7W99_00865 [Rhodospirillales bacterium 20-58-10]